MKKLLVGLSSVLLSAAGLLCVGARLVQTGVSPPLDLLAAELALPAGTGFSEDTESPDSDVQGSSVDDGHDSSDAEPAGVSAVSRDESSRQEVSSAVQEADGDNGFEASEPTKKELLQYEKEHEGEERFPVNEFNTTIGNVSYKNIQVKNNSSADIDIEAELNADMGFSLENTDQPQVLIYHTHTSESFLKYDTGFFYESFYPRSQDKSENVCAVGEELARQLNSAGIRTIHDTTVHDDPTYSGAYDRSLDTVNSYLQKYPSIKVVLDIHRDGIGTDEEKSKPVFMADGHKAAQVMILAGYNYDGCEEFTDWEYNLRFALKIQDEASREYPDMMRPLYFSDFMYNMNVCRGSLLIEIGAESNTIEEVRYSGYLLGKIIARCFHEKASPAPDGTVTEGSA